MSDDWPAYECCGRKSLHSKNCPKGNDLRHGKHTRTAKGHVEIREAMTIDLTGKNVGQGWSDYVGRHRVKMWHRDQTMMHQNALGLWFLVRDGRVVASVPDNN